ncbi:MAG: DsbA family protein [Gammaproteobacteria bacterium]
MNIRIRITRALVGLCLLVAAGASLTPAFCGAETTTAEATVPAINQDATQAILQELREIRRVLEKIEQQGLVRPTRRPDTPKTASVSIGKENTMLGAADAPVTVVEFTDYQCAFCKRFIQTTFPLLKRDFIDTGKVRWIVRDLPLGFHPNANKAAQAAHCAGDYGKFWEMRDTLFRNNANLGIEQLSGYAREIGLDGDAFDACLSSDRHQAQIAQGSQEADRIRITGTPSFVIGKTATDTVSGQRVIGAQAPAVFIAAIQRVLDQVTAGKHPPAKKPDAG